MEGVVFLLMPTPQGRGGPYCEFYVGEVGELLLQLRILCLLVYYLKCFLLCVYNRNVTEATYRVNQILHIYTMSGEAVNGMCNI